MCHAEVIYNEMRYINLRFTSLCTYCYVPGVLSTFRNLTSLFGNRRLTLFGCRCSYYACVRQRQHAIFPSASPSPAGSLPLCCHH